MNTQAAALKRFHDTVETADALDLRQIAAEMRFYRFRQEENRALDRLAALTRLPRIGLRQQAFTDAKMMRLQ